MTDFDGCCWLCAAAVCRLIGDLMSFEFGRNNEPSSVLCENCHVKHHFEGFGGKRFPQNVGLGGMGRRTLMRLF